MTLCYFISMKKGISQYFNPTLYQRNDATPLYIKELMLCHYKGHFASLTKETKPKYLILKGFCLYICYKLLSLFHVIVTSVLVEIKIF